MINSYRIKHLFFRNNYLMITEFTIIKIYLNLLFDTFYVYIKIHINCMMNEIGAKRKYM